MQTYGPGTLKYVNSHSQLHFSSSTWNNSAGNRAKTTFEGRYKAPLEFLTITEVAP